MFRPRAQELQPQAAQSRSKYDAALAWDELSPHGTARSEGHPCKPR
eukprot:CAMPEP_0195139386 /NCGR_PEP_ID=MMETSP0448-20130528/159315_1 /TAXON_ID=66468 /ORGANISM="Heterocapsa triquestra, Strain CCMP 448" /LENGTH=45 /DNA_ID= /DNA_START= /DNA_END= /DNA_ORIENTATION=